MKNFIGFDVLIYRNIKTVMFLLCLYSAGKTNLNAANENILFSNYTVVDGLSQNSVMDILEDSSGFLWIATKNGLNRFDGDCFQIFKVAGPESKKISNNIVNCLTQDEQGNVWIGTDYGLNVYSQVTNKITQYFKSDEGLSSDKILSMLIDKDGLLWIGYNGDGVDVLELNNNGFKRIHHFEPNVDSGKIKFNGNRIYNIYEDSFNNKWLCTDNGLIEIDSRLKESQNYTKENAPWLLVKDNVFHDIKQCGNYYWIATSVGLYKVDFTQQISLAFYEGRSVHSLPHNDVRSIEFDSKGNLLIGSIGGYSVLELNRNTIKSYISNENNPRSLSTNFVICVYQDKNQNVWLGTAGGGVYRYNLRQNGYEYYTHSVINKNSLNINNINTVLDSEKWLFIGTCGGGINVLDKLRDKYFYLSLSKNSTTLNKAAGDYISALYLDNKGVLWSGSWGDGISYIDTRVFPVDRLQKMDYGTGSKSSLTGRFVSCIKPDIYGNKWIGMKEGLNMLKKDNTIVDFSSLGIEDVSEILYHSGGALWVATADGLHILKSHDKKVLDVSNCVHKVYNSDSGMLKGHIITTMEEDYEGNVWLGTYDQGVNKAIVNLETALPDSFISYSVKDGLCNETIYSIVEDNNKNLWFSTDFGLSKYLTRQKLFLNYYKNDGLLSNQFSWSAGYKNENNKLFFGSPKGLLAFYPDSIQDYIPNPKILLTSFKLSGEEVNAGTADSPLSKSMNLTDSIVLRSYQNSFAIGFVALNLRNPDIYGYKYYLEGVDDDWIEPVSSHEAQYNKVRPGKYTFLVKAFEKCRTDNQTVRSVFIRIKPAFYQTLAFKLSLVFLFVFLLLFSFNSRIKRLKIINKKLERKVNDRTTEIRRQNEEINLQQNLLLERAKELESSNNQLNDINLDLEEKVLTRTMALQDAKEKAEISDRLKTTFLENLSHEIRTPLNAIIGFSGLTFDSTIPEDERKEFYSIVKRSSATLLKLIDDILEISKLETGEFIMSPKEFSINELLIEIKEIYQFELDRDNEKNKINLKINISEDIEDFIIYTDPHRISQVLHVLLNNAMKYTSSGYIEIGCLLQDEFYLKFYVKDTGIGISQQNQAIIFERFRKADDHQDVMYRGAGIGLTIAKKLVSFMGGNIWVDSKVNEGSTFYFTIEKRCGKEIFSKEPNSPKSTRITNIPDFSGKIILVAEDDEANFHYLNSLLERTKAHIIHAKNGTEVISLFEEGRIIDIVLMDIRMPYMDGYEAFERIRDRGVKIPVVAQTSYGFSEDLKKINEMGFSDCLTKPLEPNDLYSILFRYL